MTGLMNESMVLILTPVKNATEYLHRYFELLRELSYPKDRLAIGMLEGDSDDATFEVASQMIIDAAYRFCRAEIWKHDTGFRLPGGIGRHHNDFQIPRRSALAQSRNRLLFNALTPEIEWVLWIDVDLIDYPPTILRDLISLDKDVVHPDCIANEAVSEANPQSIDRNAWRKKGSFHLHDLRGEGPLVPLDTVGGTMLLVRADAHRQGLIFPTFPYGRRNLKIREPYQNFWHGEIETEGFGILAGDMGIQCWGATQLRTIHR